MLVACKIRLGSAHAYNKTLHVACSGTSTLGFVLARHSSHLICSGLESILSLWIQQLFWEWQQASPTPKQFNVLSPFPPLIEHLSFGAWLISLLSAKLREVLLALEWIDLCHFSFDFWSQDMCFQLIRQLLPAQCHKVSLLICFTIPYG